MVSIKILVLADLHGVYMDDYINENKLQSRDFDLLFLLGDINIWQLKAIKKYFKDKEIYGVLGNHDDFGMLDEVGIVNMHNNIVNIEGERGSLVVGGVEGSIKYKRAFAPMYIQEQIIELLSHYPKLDIIISHNSPYGVHDKGDLAHEGYMGLTDYIVKHSPKICIHGHQHINRVTTCGETTVIGVYEGAIMDTDTREVEYIPFL